jgi:heme/copper-type cytochrome/quinol oxidase subunit 2
VFENLSNLHNVHAAILGVCSALALAVFVVMLRSIALFRGSPTSGAQAVKRKLMELIWAIVPIVIVAAAAMPAMRPLVSGGEVRVVEEMTDRP